ncbi:nucleic acid-binding, OB-fold protein [Artemisia annua]|uniref:Nucleic acid-binding, OB-fold protein n=1 Tax=Artemisia annua TaxID=35608 RepID=A0A2U1ND55_ARTAN|nr:nucleic acid-binding, OB-fold protein [Artemisia annua]
MKQRSLINIQFHINNSKRMHLTSHRMILLSYFCKGIISIDGVSIGFELIISWRLGFYFRYRCQHSNPCYIKDLSAVKDNITLRVRVLRTWIQEMYNKLYVKNLEMILMDETPKYRIVNNALCQSFLSNTLCEPCPDFTGSMYGFDFRNYISITDLQIEEDGQFGFGHDLHIFCRGMSLTMYVQNGYHGTKLFLFNASEPIEKDEFRDVEAYRLRLFSRQEAEPSVASRISAGSKFSTKDDFLNKYPVKNIVELLDVEKNIASVIVGTIIAIQEEEGWWYLGCRKCSKKVVKDNEFVDLDAHTTSKSTSSPDQWRCTKCNEIVKGIKSISPYQLCEKYGLENADQQVLLAKITGLVGKRLAFKVSIDEYNQKKMLHVFPVLRLSDDVYILSALTASATPVKYSEATSSKVVGISSLDLESQTDETVTPTNVLKSTATSPHANSINGKRFSDAEPSSECSKTKRQIVDIKMDKSP